MGKFDECQVSSGDVRRVRDQIMHQLSGGFANFGHSKQLKEKFNELYMLFEHTVNDKEGHSALLIGPRSTGKTTIINKALEELESKYSGQFLTIRLNATIHSDDGIALREIARQLDEEVKRINAFQVELEYQLDNTNFEQRSINDTFANILLSLDNNMHSEQDEASTTISIIFVIEEFEKFTNNNKQTLLYNLFDLSQSSSTAVCVLGVSTKVTTRELLERRVRSRFSQRIITTSKSSSLEEFWTDAKLGLLFDESLFNSLDNAEYGKLWNSYFEFLFNECAQVTNFRKLVFQNYYTVKNIKDFYNSCMFAVSQIHSSAPFPSDMVFSKYLNSQLSNCVQGIVRSLSTSELLLTIAAARWVEKYELQAINFNLAYAEYKSMMKNYNLNTTSGSTGLDSKMISNFRINHKLFSSKILRTCWESLYKLGLLLDSGGITTNNEGHIITNANLNKNLIIEENKMVQLDITLDEISTFMDDHNAFKRLTKL
ncbi:origin recognition complex subunit 4 C-terminus-domain-containing protein [Scheffersomyces xylosifermentans]|uniref:origin recognition complex subunit 4 C-terminus-domain-containing protein n=1 Tax=Scheffersomyces xylosifermentans TaxID=1304137 RepID=UPI00315C9DAE